MVDPQQFGVLLSRAKEKTEYLMHILILSVAERHSRKHRQFTWHSFEGIPSEFGKGGGRKGCIYHDFLKSS